MPRRQKPSDAAVIALNSVGMSLTYIGKKLDVHPTTVLHRLKALGIPAADTRRAFMEEIFDSLTLDQQVWLLERLDAGYSIKDLIRNLLVVEFVRQRQA